MTSDLDCAVKKARVHEVRSIVYHYYTSRLEELSSPASHGV